MIISLLLRSQINSGKNRKEQERTGKNRKEQERIVPRLKDLSPADADSPVLSLVDALFRTDKSRVGNLSAATPGNW
ncbi:hypothetical protein N9U06_01745 [Gammaproteobacteria bacterium]|nr:hypothetical protein [Gammaproteobacteria bacterium]